MVDQICEEGVPAYTDTVATEKSNHQTVVNYFAKSSKRINTYLREMSDAKNYTLQTEMLYKSALLKDGLQESTNAYLDAIKRLRQTDQKLQTTGNESDLTVERVPKFGKVNLHFEESTGEFYSATSRDKKTNELKKSLHPYLTNTGLNELLIDKICLK